MGASTDVAACSNALVTDSTDLPDSLKSNVSYVTFGEGLVPHDGVELMLTNQGVTFARRHRKLGSYMLAYWLIDHPRWQGRRTVGNVAEEIATHALYTKWPLLGKRANPVNVEYFQQWPFSLVLLVRDKLLARLRGSQRIEKRING